MVCCCACVPPLTHLIDVISHVSAWHPFSLTLMDTERIKHYRHLLNIELRTLLPSEQPQLVCMDYKLSKAFHRDAGPCWLQCFPQLCKVGCMFFGWWTILDTHRKLLRIKNSAELRFLRHSNRCNWHLLPYTVQRHLNILSCPFTLWMAHIHNPCLNCLKV